MFRDIFLKVSRTITERRASTRKKFDVPIKVWFEPEFNTVNFKSPNLDLYLLGKTRDLSSTGIGFNVPSIRIKEDYLVGQDRTLNVEMDLAGRKVRMKVVGRRYEQTGIHLSEDRFFVGAEIIYIEDHDRQTYEQFLRNGKRIIKTVTASVEFG